MNGLEILRRLAAFEKGKALPYGKTKHVAVTPASQTLFVAFVRMGGESMPWGVAWKKPGKSPKCLTVPEPRDRELVARMMAGEFAVELVTHLLHPTTTDDEFDRDRLPSLRQVWLPGPSHVEMLHLLAMAYAFAKKGPPDRVERLRLLGQTANFLFLESQRPGQMMVIDATRLLREAYTFPADDLRQAHLGFLLAWLTTEGKRAVRIEAAAAAEALAVSTAMDPEIERSMLEPEVAVYHRETAARGEDGRFERRPPNAAAARAAEKIEACLKKELSRRLDLIEETWRFYREDARRPNNGLQALIDVSRKEHLWDFLIPQKKAAEDDSKPFIRSPRTDRNARTAAANYLEAEASLSRRIEKLIDDDADLIEEVLAAGNGFVGTIEDVCDEGAQSDKGRWIVRPVWTVKCRGAVPLRLRPGEMVAQRGLQKRTAKILSIEAIRDGRVFKVEVKGCKTRPRDGDPSVLAGVDPGNKGRQVMFLQVPVSYFDEKRSFLVRMAKGPGAWVAAEMGASGAEIATEDEG